MLLKVRPRWDGWFLKKDIPLLFEALQLIQSFRCQQGTVCDGIEDLCILLRRFAYPCKYSDLIPRFDRPVSELNVISNLVLETNYHHHRHRITRWNDALLNPILFETNAQGIHQKGSPLTNCFGFIDGTVRPFCRPGENQQVVYNE